LNWYGTPAEKLEFYAEAFHLAGSKLAKEYGTTGAARDIEACPIVSLYRHALELYLKAILIPGEDFMRLRHRPSLDLAPCINGHRLPDLATRFLRVAKEMGWGEDMGVEGLHTHRAFLDLINEWDRVDQGSFSFRYPMDKAGASSLSDHFSFSLNAFCRRMDSLFTVLDGSVTAVEQALEAELEARAYQHE
jgi:hypothetical protein